MSIRFLFGRPPSSGNNTQRRVKGVMGLQLAMTGTVVQRPPKGVMGLELGMAGRSRSKGVMGLSLAMTGSGLRPRGVMGFELSMTGTAPAGQTWPNGFTWQYEFRLRARPGSGTVANVVLPFGLIHPEWRSAANGGRVQSDLGRDIRFESAAGKLGHVLLGYDPATGAIAALVNIDSRTYEQDQSLYLYVGKSGLGASEENATNARAGGWLFFHSGHSASDFSGQGRDFTTNTGVAAATMGAWPAGRGNGSSSYRARTSAEMDGKSGLTWVMLLQADSAAATMEAFNVAPLDVSDLSAASLTNGAFFQNVDCGGVLTQLRTVPGLVRLGVPQALSGAWSSGTAPDLALDGAVPELGTTPGSTSGVTAINEALELFRGGRGTVGYWNGLIGPFMACDRRLPLEVRKEMTLALTRPLAVFGIGQGNRSNEANAAPVAMPLDAQAAAGSPVTIDAAAAAYDPNGDTIALTGAPTATAGTVTIVSGKLRYAPPTPFSGAVIDFQVKDQAGKTGRAQVTVAARTSPCSSPRLGKVRRVPKGKLLFFMHKSATGVLSPMAAVAGKVTQCAYVNSSPFDWKTDSNGVVIYDHSANGINATAQKIWNYYLAKKGGDTQNNVCWWDWELSGSRINTNYSINVPSSVGYTKADGGRAAWYTISAGLPRQELRTEAARYAAALAKRLVEIAEAAGQPEFEQMSYSHIPFLNRSQLSSADTLFGAAADDLESTLLCPYMLSSGPQFYFQTTAAQKSNPVTFWTDLHAGFVRSLRRVLSPSTKLVPAIWAVWNDGAADSTFAGNPLPVGYITAQMQALIDAGVDGFILWTHSAIQNGSSPGIKRVHQEIADFVDANGNFVGVRF